MYSTNEEKEIASIIVSCITSYGQNGIPLNEIQEEFEFLCGYPIPYKKFGCESVKSFLITLPHIYILKDEFNNDIVIEQSPKSTHIKNMIKKQKPRTKENLIIH
ncbi:hypothetical protein HHI36_023624 [Cryptolaemus montrouzieri]|uniref:HTH OST-type domain-containing protein n=1 Tax=Cryptolaemus montrouzieri TaxID=559131 RepID=A0ABD2PI76_9CUCU